MEDDRTREINSQAGQQGASCESTTSGGGKRRVAEVAAAAAGAALGAAGEAAAEQLVRPQPEQNPEAVSYLEPVAEPAPTPVAEAVPDPEPVPIPEPEPTPVPEPEPASDPDVRVVGVGVADNGEGGVATIIEVQVGDVAGRAVDIESDGRIDGLAFDENGNGQYDENEVHDVRGEGISTGQMLHTYVTHAQAQGNTPTATDLDTGRQLEIVQTTDGGFDLEPMDGDLMAQQCGMDQDDMPDYMPDADAGIMDA